MDDNSNSNELITSKDNPNPIQTTKSSKRLIVIVCLVFSVILLFIISILGYFFLRNSNQDFVEPQDFVKPNEFKNYPFNTLYFTMHDSGQLKKMDSEGNLTDLPCSTQEFDVIISPRQDKIYCGGTGEYPYDNHYIHDLGSSHSELIDSVPKHASPFSTGGSNVSKWSSDGKRLLFIGRSVNDLHIMNVDTLEVEGIYSASAELWDASFSPDGERIAIIERYNIENDVISSGAWTMGVSLLSSRGDLEKLIYVPPFTEKTEYIEEAYFVKWSNDGKKILIGLRKWLGRSKTRVLLYDVSTDETKEINTGDIGITNGFFTSYNFYLDSENNLLYTKYIGNLDRFPAPLYTVQVYKADFNTGEQKLVKEIESGETISIANPRMTADAKWITYQVLDDHRGDYDLTYIEELEGDRKIELFKDGEMLILNNYYQDMGMSHIYWY